MPRVQSSRLASGSSSFSHNHQSSKIALNDDLQEKAARLQSRQAMQSYQLDQIKAAASPARRVSGSGISNGGGPSTPKNQSLRKDAMDGGALLAVVPAGSMTPMKRVPILANFEEWMKMATDNKINATNSWNFALIDYFHDMSLLKEGDSVNFQKASCTLDGCVKIYTSRVDSVATETGKLLSGLASGGSKKQQASENENAEGDGEEDEEGEEGGRRPNKRKRALEATLVSTHEQLQLKKFELEFTVDPLFKKATADFDQGGAKGLLLNHLAIDNKGRVVFDSSDDSEDIVDGDYSKFNGDDDRAELEESTQTAAMAEIQPRTEAVADEVIAELGSKYFPDLDDLESRYICPSLRNVDFGDPVSSLEIFSSKQNGLGGSDSQHDSDDTHSQAFDDGFLAGADDGTICQPPMDECDTDINAGFGEGGEVWAKDAVLEAPHGHHQDPGDFAQGASDHGDGGLGAADPRSDSYALFLGSNKANVNAEGVWAYFDSTAQRTWTGPEHWKIKRMKDTKANAAAPTRRKEKKPFEIQFASPLPEELETLFASANSKSAICLPKQQWRNASKNLLPDDKYFSSSQFLRLFLKPKARIGSLGAGKRSRMPLAQETGLGAEVDGNFWALQAKNGQLEENALPPKASYDANFFQDDGLASIPLGDELDDDDDGVRFEDAPEGVDSSKDGALGLNANENTSAIQATPGGGFGSQLVTQSTSRRPEYVQYAKAAKKVDVRRLKDEMWKGTGYEKEQQLQPDEMEVDHEEEPLKFTSLINGLRENYPKEAMADISTSYCFICLLHLANEKGLEIQSSQDLEELSVRRNTTVLSEIEV